jgi:putative transposase
LQGRTAALEDLAVEPARPQAQQARHRGCLHRWGRPLLCRAAVSQLSERLWTEYQAFAQRDLAEHDIIYLFVDGVAERLGPVSRASRCSPPADRPAIVARSYALRGLDPMETDNTYN